MSYEEILSRMQAAYKKESGAKADDAADIGIRLKVLAGEIYRLLTELDWLRRQAFPQTATGRELNLHASQRGLARRPARKAQGVLRFSRTEALGYDVGIPKGTVCATAGADSVEYETTGQAVLAAGKLFAEVPAQAVEGGAAGNAAAGSIHTLVTPPVGVEKAVNPEAFSGGSEAEDDETLRQRLLQAYSVLSNGTNAEFYRRRALEAEGVYSAMAVPRADGAGTVTVYIWGQGEAPPETVVTAVQSRLSAEREVNVEVTVKAAAKKLLNVFGYIKPREGTAFDEAAARIREDLGRYYAAKKIGDSVYISEIGAVFMNTGLVKTYKLAVNVMDYAGETGVIPVLGSASIQVMS